MNKKNKKGELNIVGLLIITAVLLIVGVIFFQATAQEIGKATNTQAIANQSLGTLTNGTALYVTNCRDLSDVKVFNATGDVEVNSANYTVTNNVIYNGALSVKVDPVVDAGGRGLGYNKGTATIDGTCQPLTYIGDSGGRAMASLILVMFGLLLVVIAMTPTLREKLLEQFGR
jgi:uncharacterized protein (UPF0333 family)